MKNIQIFSSSDPLREFKETAKKRFPNCVFYSSPINSYINVGAGFYDDNEITETIITNETIALQKRIFKILL